MNSRLLLVIFYAVCGVSFVHAQTNTTGHIVGRVVTSEDIVVQNTIITVTNLETQNFRAIPGKTDGSFRFAALPVGTYRLSVESPGYMVAEREPIRVSIGSGTKLNVVLIPGDAPLQLDKVSVVSKQTSMIDVTSTESTTIITDQQINRLPVGRDLESVALLAPGTTRSPVFGLVGFGGASVAENAYYVNGMNLTNFRNGMGGGTVPFEFYREFEVKTGGYGAEFGRSTGGVVNAVTKRGGDEFSFGTSVFWEPDSLRENSSNISQLNDDILDYQSYESANESDSLNANLYASGPVFRDHLYFYALIEHRKNDSYSESGPSSTFGWPVVFADSSSSDDIFWGIKLDWQINGCGS